MKFNIFVKLSFTFFLLTLTGLAASATDDGFPLTRVKGTPIPELQEKSVLWKVLDHTNANRFTVTKEGDLRVEGITISENLAEEVGLLKTQIVRKRNLEPLPIESCPIIRRGDSMMAANLAAYASFDASGRFFTDGLIENEECLQLKAPKTICFCDPHIFSSQGPIVFQTDHLSLVKSFFEVNPDTTVVQIFPHSGDHSPIKGIQITPQNKFFTMFGDIDFGKPTLNFTVSHAQVWIQF